MLSEPYVHAPLPSGKFLCKPLRTCLNKINFCPSSFHSCFMSIILSPAILRSVLPMEQGQKKSPHPSQGSLPSLQSVRWSTSAASMRRQATSWPISLVPLPRPSPPPPGCARTTTPVLTPSLARWGRADAWVDKVCNKGLVVVGDKEDTGQGVLSPRHSCYRSCGMGIATREDAMEVGVDKGQLLLGGAGTMGGKKGEEAVVVIKQIHKVGGIEMGKVEQRSTTRSPACSTSR
jgi:hypothetical protein